MPEHGKRYRNSAALIDREKNYEPSEAIALAKQGATATTRHAYVDRTGRPVRLAPDDPFFLAVRNEADKGSKYEKVIEQGQMAKDAYEIFIGRVRDVKRRSHG